MGWIWSYLWPLTWMLVCVYSYDVCTCCVPPPSDTQHLLVSVCMVFVHTVFALCSSHLSGGLWSGCLAKLVHTGLKTWIYIYNKWKKQEVKEVDLAWRGAEAGGHPFQRINNFSILTQFSFGIQGRVQLDINLRKSMEEWGHLWAIHYNAKTNKQFMRQREGSEGRLKWKYPSAVS